MTSNAVLPIGTNLSFLPLPNTLAILPIMSTLSTSNPTNSLTLIPVEYKVSNIALSLLPNILSEEGVSTNFTASSSDKNFGKTLSNLGDIKRVAGLFFIKPSLCRNLKKLLIADNFLEIVLGLKFFVLSCAKNLL